MAVVHISRFRRSPRGIIALMATAGFLCVGSPVWADQITLGSSGSPAYDLTSDGSGAISADTGGYTAQAIFGSDVGTANFGATSFIAGPQVNGVFSVTSGGAEALTVTLPDGDTASGTVQITQIDDDSPNPHIAFTWDYTSSGDTDFLSSFPGGSGTGEYIFATVTTLLDDFVTAPGSQSVIGSAGQIDDVPVPEPGTLVLLGIGLIGVWGAFKMRPAGLAV